MDQQCYLCGNSSSLSAYSCEHKKCSFCLACYLLKSEFASMNVDETVFVCECGNGKLSLPIAKIAEVFSNNNAESIPKCNKHKNEAECYCVDCKLWLCGECKKAFHDEYCSFHKTEKKSGGNDNNCKVHQKKKEKYCSECKREMCEQCVNDDSKHSDKMINLSDKRKAMQDEIKQKMKIKDESEVEKIIKEKEDTYMQTIEQAEKCINEKAEKIINEIKKLIVDVDAKKNKEIAYLNAMFMSLKFAYKNIFKNINDDNASINTLSEINKLNTSIESLSILPSETKEMDILLESLYKLIPSTILNVKLSFTSDNENQNTISSSSIPEDKEKIIQKLKAAKSEKKNPKDNSITTYTPHSEFTTSCIRIDDETIATSGTDKTIRFYHRNTSTGAYEISEKEKIDDFIYTVRSMHLIPNTTKIVVGLSDGKLQLWDTSSLENICSFENYHTDCVRKIIQISDNILASCSDDTFIKLWSTDNYECEGVFKGHESKVYDIVKLDDKRIVSCGEEGMINIWIIETKGVMKSVIEHEQGVLALCKMQNGQITSASKDKSIKIWDMKSMTCKNTISNAHSDWVTSLCEITEGTLASGGRDNLVKLWDMESNECIKVFEGHCGTIINIIKEEGLKVITCSCDNTIKIWNI